MKKGDLVILKYRHFGYKKLFQVGNIHKVYKDHVNIYWLEGGTSSESKHKIIKIPKFFRFLFT